MSRQCPTCGAKTVRYKHGLNSGLIQGLARLCEAGGEANLADLALTRNQWDNFQKLRYWSLVEPVFEDGTRKSGIWSVTPRGLEFLVGEITVPRHVWTYRGEFVEYDGADVSVEDVVAGYKHRPEYATEAVPV